MSCVRLIGSVFVLFFPLASCAKDFHSGYLIKAAARGDTAVVRKLLDAGADVNARDIFGSTALISAIGNESSNTF